MLALVSIFLITTIVSAATIWVYRKMSGWHGFTETLVGRPRSTQRKGFSAQHGFISLDSKPAKKTKKVKLRGSRSSVKTPWGW